MSFAALNGSRVISASVTLPPYGAWSADVVLASSESIAPNVTLTIGNLSLVGFTVRSASFASSRSARLVGGYGGWRKALKPRQYTNPGGVSLAMVLRDAAAEVGEKVNVVTDARVGGANATQFVRDAGPAAQLLTRLVGTVWWIDPSGVTQVSARPSPTITTPLDVIRWSGGRGWFELATEDYAAWVPGATFTAPTVTGTQTIASITHRIENDGRLRSEVLSSS